MIRPRGSCPCTVRHRIFPVAPRRCGPETNRCWCATTITVGDYWKDVYEDELAKGTEGDQRVIDNAITNRDVWSKRRGYSVIFMGLLYVANVVDAMVDAHFLKFNVSDDLSMRIAPNLDPIPSQFAFDSFSYGVKLSLNF